MVLYSDLTGSAICSLETRSPGTTHIRYSSDGNFLFAAARKVISFTQYFDNAIDKRSIFGRYFRVCRNKCFQLIAFCN